MEGRAMIDLIDAFYELKYNPFEFGGYLASFYDQLEDSEENLLLAPLVIPLCTHPIYGRKIFNSNIRSSIWSIFDDRTRLYDLQERTDDFRELTELSIQYCLVNDWLMLDSEKLVLRINNKAESKYVCQKKAEKLASLFSGYSVVEIYAFLGVKP